MTVNQLVLGLAILTKYSSRGDDSLIEAQHDIIYFDPSAEEVSKEDADKLDKIGWHFDDEAGGWAHFT